MYTVNLCVGPRGFGLVGEQIDADLLEEILNDFKEILDQLDPIVCGPGKIDFHVLHLTVK